jgi:hypothetical protein
MGLQGRGQRLRPDARARYLSDLFELRASAAEVGSTDADRQLRS